MVDIRVFVIAQMMKIVTVRAPKVIRREDEKPTLKQSKKEGMPSRKVIALCKI